MAYTDKLRVVYGDYTLGVHGEGYDYIFSYAQGGLESIVKNGYEWLYRCPKPTFWRALTDNDRGSRFHIKSGSWLSADMFIDCKEVQVIMDGKEQKPYAPDNNSYGCDVYADEIVVKYTYETITTPATTVLVSYTVDVSGKIRVDVHYNGVQGLPEFPVFGMRFIMPTLADKYLYKGLSGTGTPDIANLMAIADLFQISVDELLSNEKSEKKQSNYIYESRTEYDIDGKKNFDIKLGGAYAVDLKAYHGEKIEVAMFSNVYKNLLADYKVKIDDIKNRIDIDLNRFNEASEADAKESLVITIFIPVKYIGKIELSVNARTLNITDIENEHIEVNGKISEVTLQGNKSEIEIDSNLDMQISVLSHEGAIEINQLSATSRLTIPADYRFRSTKKGIATHIYYERQGKKVDDFSDAEADNYIELNGIKSELVIVEAEV